MDIRESLHNQMEALRVILKPRRKKNRELLRHPRPKGLSPYKTENVKQQANGHNTSSKRMNQTLVKLLTAH